MDSLPCLLFKSNLSIKSFETIAVEDIVKADPTTKAIVKSNPNNREINSDAANVIKTCAPPNPKRMPRIEFNFGKLNSRPMENIRKTMPNSTKCLTDSLS